MSNCLFVWVYRLTRAFEITYFPYASIHKLWLVIYKYEPNLPRHVLPSPVNPGLHAHWNDPITLLQSASEEQSCVFKKHSSVSTRNDILAVLNNLLHIMSDSWLQ